MIQSQMSIHGRTRASFAVSDDLSGLDSFFFHRLHRSICRRTGYSHRFLLALTFPNRRALKLSSPLFLQKLHWDRANSGLLHYVPCASQDAELVRDQVFEARGWLGVKPARGGTCSGRPTHVRCRHGRGCGGEAELDRIVPKALRSGISGIPFVWSCLACETIKSPGNTFIYLYF